MLIHLPDLALSELSELNSSPGLDALAAAPVSDPLASALGRALLTVMALDNAPSRGPAEHILLALCAHIVAHHGSSQAPANHPARPDPLRRAQAMLVEDLTAGPHLDDVAAACGLSPHRLARTFHDHVGLSPLQWVRAERIKAARTMLERTDEPLAGIAAVCGFADQSHLTRAFRTSFGTTPGAHRREFASAA